MHTFYWLIDYYFFPFPCTFLNEEQICLQQGFFHNLDICTPLVSSKVPDQKCPTLHTRQLLKMHMKNIHIKTKTLVMDPGDFNSLWFAFKNQNLKKANSVIPGKDFFFLFRRAIFAGITYLSVTSIGELSLSWSPLHIRCDKERDLSLSFSMFFFIRLFYNPLTS